MLKIDLHTHSEASPDGGITLRQYRAALENGLLDCIAITDHNRIDFATRAKLEMGDRIIVGEEIMTTDGEIVGLFLETAVRAGQTPEATVLDIKAQGGLVYVPHPFETIRKGLHPAALERIQEAVDIMEVCNGRAFLQNRSEQALVWAKLNDIAMAASSDAHGARGLGRTYTSVSQKPDRDTLTGLLNNGSLHTRRPAMRSLLYPKYHKAKKKILKRL